MNRQELGEALQTAGIPALWYAIQGVRDPDAGVESHYFVAAPPQGFLVGISERGEDRISGAFADEAEACKMLHDHLVFDHQPVVHAATDMPAAQQHITALTKMISKAAAKTAKGQVPLDLQPGYLVDRFGGESGSMLYPDGNPFQNRSLPPTALVAYRRYRVEQPIPAHASIVPPWFGQPGGAVVFRLDPAPFDHPPLFSIGWLVRNKLLSRLTSIPLT